MSIQNIKLNSVRSLDSKLISDKYYDYMLYRGEIYGPSGIEDCLISYINMDNDDSVREDGSIQSSSAWTGYINEGVEIASGKTGFGITGVDNGRIHYIKDLITNREFLKHFFSGLTIDESEDRLVLYPVTGNTLQHCYKYDIDCDCCGSFLALKGGFFQGFYKLYGKEYQMLPDYIDTDWHIEFLLRPRSDYQECETSLNNLYPENKGLFFYLGTRAENKYAEIYNETYKPTFERGNIEKPTFYDEGDAESELYGPIASLLYDEPDVSVSAITIDALQDEFDILTDNKHLFFDRSCNGFTTKTWDHEDEPIVSLRTQKRPDYKENPFIIFNRTCTGLTTKDAEEYLEESREDYDMMKDVIGNAFALKYNDDDGSLSYRYTIKDCDSESGFTTVEETTKPGLVKDKEWNLINVRFEIINHDGYDNCGKPINLGRRRMRIHFYVNGYQVYISKELPELYLQPLNDLAERQWGVPYNLSLGGGTQGLGERIWLDYYQPITNHYYLEENYAGTFIGDIKSMKFYNCKKQFADIYNNYLIEIGGKEEEPEVRTDIMYAGFALKPSDLLDGKHNVKAPTETYIRLVGTAQANNSHFYVLIPDTMKGKMPVEFTAGGAPMVMDRSTEFINKQKYTLFTSGADYPAGASLTIMMLCI